MFGLGIFYALIAVLFGCGAAFLFSDSRGGGEWRAMGFGLGLLAGGVAMVFLFAATMFLAMQVFVRRGSRRARMYAMLYCVVMTVLPLLLVALACLETTPDATEFWGTLLGVGLWMLPFGWVWRLLRKAGRDVGA